MEIGLYFGSFNPVHDGHVLLSKIFQQQSQVDQVWWVLSPHNPFKETKDLAVFEHRAQMVNLVLPEGHCLCSIEDSLTKPSYTIQTLRALQSQYPTHQWEILMGADSWNTLPKWKDGEIIENECSIWVYPRLFDSELVSPLRQGACKVLNGEFVTVSSTAIRKGLIERREKPIGLADSVWDYIIEHRLYQALI